MNYSQEKLVLLETLKKQDLNLNFYQILNHLKYVDENEFKENVLPVLLNSKGFIKILTLKGNNNAHTVEEYLNMVGKDGLNHFKILLEKISKKKELHDTGKKTFKGIVALQNCFNNVPIDTQEFIDNNYIINSKFIPFVEKHKDNPKFTPFFHLFVLEYYRHSYGIYLQNIYSNFIGNNKNLRTDFVNSVTECFNEKIDVETAIELDSLTSFTNEVNLAIADKIVFESFSDVEKFLLNINKRKNVIVSVLPTILKNENNQKMFENYLLQLDSTSFINTINSTLKKEDLPDNQVRNLIENYLNKNIKTFYLKDIDNVMKLYFRTVSSTHKFDYSNLDVEVLDVLLENETAKKSLENYGRYERNENIFYILNGMVSEKRIPLKDLAHNYSHYVETFINEEKSFLEKNQRYSFIDSLSTLKHNNDLIFSLYISCLKNDITTLSGNNEELKNDLEKFLCPNIQQFLTLIQDYDLPKEIYEKTVRNINSYSSVLELENLRTISELLETHKDKMIYCLNYYNFPSNIKFSDLFTLDSQVLNNFIEYSPSFEIHFDEYVYTPENEETLFNFFKGNSLSFEKNKEFLRKFASHSMYEKMVSIFVEKYKEKEILDILPYGKENNISKEYIAAFYETGCFSEIFNTLTKVNSYFFDYCKFYNIDINLFIKEMLDSDISQKNFFESFDKTAILSFFENNPDYVSKIKSSKTELLDLLVFKDKSYELLLSNPFVKELMKDNGLNLLTLRYEERSAFHNYFLSLDDTDEMKLFFKDVVKNYLKEYINNVDKNVANTMFSYLYLEPQELMDIIKEKPLSSYSISGTYLEIFKEFYTLNDEDNITYFLENEFKEILSQKILNTVKNNMENNEEFNVKTFSNNTLGKLYLKYEDNNNFSNILTNVNKNYNLNYYNWNCYNTNTNIEPKKQHLIQKMFLSSSYYLIPKTNFENGVSPMHFSLGFLTSPLEKRENAYREEEKQHNYKFRTQELVVDSLKKLSLFGKNEKPMIALYSSNEFSLNDKLKLILKCIKSEMEKDNFTFFTYIGKEPLFTEEEIKKLKEIGVEFHFLTKTKYDFNEQNLTTKTDEKAYELLFGSGTPLDTVSCSAIPITSMIDNLEKAIKQLPNNEKNHYQHFYDNFRSYKNVIGFLSESDKKNIYQEEWFQKEKETFFQTLQNTSNNNGFHFSGMLFHKINHFLNEEDFLKVFEIVSNYTNFDDIANSRIMLRKISNKYIEWNKETTDELIKIYLRSNPIKTTETLKDVLVHAKDNVFKKSLLKIIQRSSGYRNQRSYIPSDIISNVLDISVKDSINQDLISGKFLKTMLENDETNGLDYYYKNLFKIIRDDEKKDDYSELENKVLLNHFKMIVEKKPLNESFLKNTLSEMRLEVIFNLKDTINEKYKNDFNSYNSIMNVLKETLLPDNLKILNEDGIIFTQEYKEIIFYSNEIISQNDVSKKITNIFSKEKNSEMLNSIFDEIINSTSRNYSEVFKFIYYANENGLKDLMDTVLKKPLLDYNFDELSDKDNELNELLIEKDKLELKKKKIPAELNENILLKKEELEILKKKKEQFVAKYERETHSNFILLYNSFLKHYETGETKTIKVELVEQSFNELKTIINKGIENISKSEFDYLKKELGNEKELLIVLFKNKLFLKNKNLPDYLNDYESIKQFDLKKFLTAKKFLMDNIPTFTTTKEEHELVDRLVILMKPEKSVPNYIFADKFQKMAGMFKDLQKTIDDEFIQRFKHKREKIAANVISKFIVTHYSHLFNTKELYEKIDLNPQFMFQIFNFDVTKKDEKSFFFNRNSHYIKDKKEFTVEIIEKIQEDIKSLKKHFTIDWEKVRELGMKEFQKMGSNVTSINTEDVQQFIIEKSPLDNEVREGMKRSYFKQTIDKLAQKAYQVDGSDFLFNDLHEISLKNVVENTTFDRFLKTFNKLYTHCKKFKLDESNIIPYIYSHYNELEVESKGLSEKGLEKLIIEIYQKQLNIENEDFKKVMKFLNFPNIIGTEEDIKDIVEVIEEQQNEEIHPVSFSTKIVKKGSDGNVYFLQTSQPTNLLTYFQGLNACTKSCLTLKGVASSILHNIGSEEHIDGNKYSTDFVFSLKSDYLGKDIEELKHLEKMSNEYNVLMYQNGNNTNNEKAVELDRKIKEIVYEYFVTSAAGVVYVEPKQNVRVLDNVEIAEFQNEKLEKEMTDLLIENAEIQQNYGYLKLLKSMKNNLEKGTELDEDVVLATNLGLGYTSDKIIDALKHEVSVQGIHNSESVYSDAEKQITINVHENIQKHRIGGKLLDFHSFHKEIFETFGSLDTLDNLKKEIHTLENEFAKMIKTSEFSKKEKDIKTKETGKDIK